MRETTKQNLAIIAITILIAASAYIFINFIKPEMEQRKDLAIKIKETQEKIKMLKDYQAKFNLLNQNYQNLGDKIEMINQALPNEPQTAQVLAILDALSKQTGILLSGLNFSTQAEEDYEKLNSLEIKANFNTTYDTFKVWLKEIEKELRIFDLNKINIKMVVSPAAAERRRSRISIPRSSVLQFSLDLLTYYQI